MARIKTSEKETEGKAITPKPTLTPKQSVKAKTLVTITQTKAQKPIPEPKRTTEQPTRRTLQDRRPALKELQKPVERKIVTKPVYDKRDNITTKRISETKEVVIKPTGTSKPGQGTLTAKPLLSGMGRGPITEARLQQERAIEEARAVNTAQQREETDAVQAFEQKKREQEEAGYRLSLDNQGRYLRKR